MSIAPAFTRTPGHPARRLRLIGRSRAASWSVTLLLGLSCLPAWSLYKVVGPDGKVTYTDRPPTDTSRTQPLGKAGGAAASADPGLPFDLQQVVGKFPVTLYTSKDCPPCDSGRAYLKQRGVPFTERTLVSNEDAEALKRLEGGTDLPVLRIGSQRVKGWSDTEWASYLDLAGYPKQSRLPPAYRYPAPAPLVAPPVPAPAAPSAPAPTDGPATAEPPGNAPPGFRF